MKTSLTTFLLVSAQAAAGAAADLEQIDEIFVTTKRRAFSMQDVSSAVAVIANESVRLNKLTSDALASSPGVFLQQTTPGQGAAIVRGLKGSAVLHLVDGMRLNNAIFRSAPTQYLALVPSTAIQRLEVVRGTPASLYGSDAVGGVVQVVTHVPAFESDNTEYRGDLRLTFDTAELGRAVSATLDSGNRRLASSLSAAYQQSGNRRIGGGERIGPSGYDAKSARALFSATPTDEQSWSVDLHYLEQPKTPRVDELVPGFGQDQPSSSEFFFIPNQRLFAHARHSRTRQGLDWNVDFAWQRIVDDRVTRDFASSERRKEENRSDLYAAVITAAHENEATSWIVGGEFYNDRVRSSRLAEDISTLDTQVLTPRYPDGSKLRQAALFGSLDRRIGTRHLLSAGLRWSSVDVVVPDTPVTPPTSLDVDDASGDLGWIFDVTDTSQLIANLGFGFRAPNVFDIGTIGVRPGNRFNIPNTDLDSEHVVHGDFGFRHQGDRVRAELVFFALEYDDRITSELTGDTTPGGRDIVQSVNAGSSSLHGFEFDVAVDLSSTLVAGMLLNYTHGEQELSADAREPADRVPPLSGRLRLSYDSGSNWRYAGWIGFADRQDRLSARDIRDNRIDPNGTAGWATLGARVQRNSASWQISATVDNLLDKRFRRHGSGIDGVGRNLSLSIRRIW